MQNYTKIHGFSKFKSIFILAHMSAIAPLSTDMYLPALKSVQESFNTSEFLTQLSIATFFIAFAFGLANFVDIIPLESLRYIEVYLQSPA